MTPGRAIALVFSAAGIVLVAALVAVQAAVPDDAGALRGSLRVVAVIVVMLAAAGQLGRWLAIPIARLAGAARLVVDAKGASPIDPTRAGPRSERMSPNRFDPTTTSNQSGCCTKWAHRMSMWYWSVLIAG